jgi:hypothetical protein
LSERAELLDVTFDLLGSKHVRLVAVMVTSRVVSAPGALQVRDDEQHDEMIEDARDVWHAAEVALGILRLGKYVPKREAMNDVRALLAWYDADESGDES